MRKLFLLFSILFASLSYAGDQNFDALNAAEAEIGVPLLQRQLDAAHTDDMRWSGYATMGDSPRTRLIRQDLLRAKSAALEKITRMTEIQSSQGNSQRNSSGIDDLAKLGVLKDKGLITDREFEAKKKQLLGL